jgi:sugar lactone lactonase YvrE
MKKSTICLVIVLTLTQACKKDMNPAEPDYKNLPVSSLSIPLNSIFIYQVSTFAGGKFLNFHDGHGTMAQFNFPKGITAYDGYLYVADQGNNAIRKIKISDKLVQSLGADQPSADRSGAPASIDFLSPTDIAMGPDNFLYVTDAGNYRIRKVNRVGQVTTYAGGDNGYVDGPISAAKFGIMTAITIQKNGTIYVYDYSVSRIRKITKAGIVSTYAGSAQGNADGPALSAEFSDIEGMAVAADGTLYVADAANNSIRKISTTGMVTTIAGSTFGYQDGPASDAKFQFPTGITVTTNGTLFIIDSGNCRARMIDPQGIVSTIAGAFNLEGESAPVDGPGTTAIFRTPFHVAYFEKALYITEGARFGDTNSDIRKVTLPNNY